MNYQETTRIIAIMSATYPQFLNNKSKDDIDMIISVWNEMLSDYGYNEIAASIKIFNSTTNSAFPPSIPQLIGSLNKVKHPDNSMPELEAWARVRKAFRCNGEDAKEEWEKLPEILKKCIDVQFLIDCGRSDSIDNQKVAMPMFLRTYRSMVERNKEIIPESIKIAMGKSNLLESKGE